MSIQGFDPNFELVRQGLSSIEFFRELHASSAPAAANAQAVVDAMRAKAESIKQSSPHAAALFENVAQGIELYIGLEPLDESKYHKLPYDGGGGQDSPPDDINQHPKPTPGH